MATATPIRVVVADDSGLMRRVVAATLREGGFEVVGEARDGDEALALCAQHQPDAMTLDLAMPGRDGIGVLRELRAGASPIPVIVVSAFSPAHGARAVDALAEGAFELVAKPAAGQGLDEFSAELCAKIAAAARARSRGRGAPAPLVPRRAAGRGFPRGTARPVVIACSTGGPKALGRLLPELPPRLGAGTVIVQHMPRGFTASLAARLDRASPLRVLEADGTESLRPDTALLAPGGRHLRLDAGNRTRLSLEDPIGGLRPRADLTIADAAGLHGERLLLVVLTGMGRDGLEAAYEVRRRGGRILVEHESTCTVYGMPRAIAEAGLADHVLPLDELAAAITEEAGT
jgi:two-component system chemotaxis response regulator CheB